MSDDLCLYGPHQMIWTGFWKSIFDAGNVIIGDGFFLSSCFFIVVLVFSIELQLQQLLEEERDKIDENKMSVGFCLHDLWECELGLVHMRVGHIYLRMSQRHFGP